MPQDDLPPIELHENESDPEKIKSTAIVKYSAPKPPTFARLQCNTDLNLPPSNWLSNAADSYGLQRVIYHQKGFSSFRIAHMFPDCVGQVDVVSDAENIKNLLKIPYNKSHVSMMVHRVENTLLLDEFDIYKHLLKTSETEWEWLKKFFFEHINRESYEEEKHLYIKNRTQKALKEKSLVSKFLYHSLVPDDSNRGDSGSNASGFKPYSLEASSSNTIQTPPLPDPSPNTECPDPHHIEFNRNVVWTFEDIEMLLGTDMPIFGGGTHPCISLRLRDMNKPISVLTGIDYWLDNLMSNVPEVVMCYHLNGIVQKYELIKTEDLPRLDNSKFSPVLITDVAQSILSFLKSNATKAGHTYWLFKGKNEDIVKLYDLTSLCSEDDMQNGQNPFTIPVAMLLYRVARNMKNSLDRRPHPGTVRMLLKNAVKLLPEEKYPEIVTSSHYMLSDLYIPAELNPENPNLEQFDREDDDASVYDDDGLPDEGGSVAVLDLDKPNAQEKFRNYYRPPPPISGSLIERCMQAISHVATGLHCLQFFNEKDENEDSHMKEEEVPMAKPFEPIPMPYKKLHEEEKATDLSDSDACLANTGTRRKKKDKKKKTKEREQKMALLPKEYNDPSFQPKWPSFNPDTISWKGHLKILLLEKAVLVYATLAEHYICDKRYGDCLRVLGLVARCQLALNRANTRHAGALRLSCLLGRAGDACFMLVREWKNLETFREQLQSHHDEDFRLLEKLEQDERAYKVNLGDSVTKTVFVYDIRTIEQMLIKSVECYTAAEEVSPSTNISFRLANSLNELGSYYLNVGRPREKREDLIYTCLKAEPYLTKSLHIFEKIKDEANTALVYSNLGHLNRLMAYAHSKERGELTSEAHSFYNASIQCYKKGLRVIGERKYLPAIWDVITWELSTVMFTLADIIYEYPPSAMTKSEAEKQIIEALQIALNHCDLNEENANYPLYQYRAALLNFKLGSLYHAIALNGTDKKQAFQLAQKFYEKSAHLHMQLGDLLNYLKTQMQKISLLETLVVTSMSAALKVKYLHSCLDAFVEMSAILELANKKEVELPEEVPDGSLSTNVSGLLELATDRLQETLKQLTSIYYNKPSLNKDSSKLLKLYKDCYRAALKVSLKLDRDKLISELYGALVYIKSLIESNSL